MPDASTLSDHDHEWSGLYQASSLWRTAVLRAGHSESAVAWVEEHVPFGDDRRMFALRAFDAALAASTPAEPEEK